MLVSWVWSGRNNTQEMNIVGVLFYDLPVALHIRDELLMFQAIEDIE